jgi:hypothetical protein
VQNFDDVKEKWGSPIGAALLFKFLLTIDEERTDVFT